jgi:hypothetical protein
MVFGAGKGLNGCKPSQCFSIGEGDGREGDGPLMVMVLPVSAAQLGFGEDNLASQRLANLIPKV